jgi:hypothetical protein
MLQTKKGIINRVVKLDKAIMQSKKPNLVIITLASEGWRIQEHYYKPNKQVDYKEHIYNDYKEYLYALNLNKNTPNKIDNLFKLY